MLKKLKYFIAGFLLIIILPGNAGVKNDGLFTFASPDRSYSVKNVNNDTLKVSDEFIYGIPDKLSDSLPDTTEHYVQKAREISPTGRFFNFFLSVQ